MSRPTLTAVLCGPNGWTLAIAHDDPSAQPPCGDVLGELVASANARGVMTSGPVCLGLPAEGVYAATLPATHDGPRSDRDSALAFVLEEKLPVDLEDVVTAFGPVIRPSQDGGGEPAVRLGLAAETRPLRERLAVAETAGLRVTAAVPTALLVAAGDTSSPDTAVWMVEDTAGTTACYSEVQRVAGTPRSWRLHPSEPPAPSTPLQPNAAAATAARAAPRRVAAFNLAHGPLRPSEAAAAYSRSWAVFAAALGILLGSAGTCGLLAARAHRHAAVIDTAATVTAYRDAFPGTDVPADLLGRLRSAARAAELDPADVASPTAAPTRTDALADLTSLGGQWPPDPKGVRLDALTLGPGAVIVGGEADDEAALAALTTALSAAGRPALAAPATQILPRGQTRFELRLATTTSDDGAAP